MTQSGELRLWLRERRGYRGLPGEAPNRKRLLPHVLHEAEDRRIGSDRSLQIELDGPEDPSVALGEVLPDHKGEEQLQAGPQRAEETESFSGDEDRAPFGASVFGRAEGEEDMEMTEVGPEGDRPVRSVPVGESIGERTFVEPAQEL